MSIESVMPSSHLILCRPLLLPPSVFASIRVFPIIRADESALLIRWPKYWSFSFNISSPNEYSGLISFRIDWLDLHAVQGTLKSVFQHRSSKASILWCSAFFIIQLSYYKLKNINNPNLLIGNINIKYFPNILLMLFILIYYLFSHKWMLALLNCSENLNFF